MGPPTPYPFTIGGVFRLGWSIFRFAWARMLLAAGLFLVPAYVISTVVSQLFGTRVDEWVSEWDRAIQNNLPTPAMPANLGVDVSAVIVSTIVTFVLSFLAEAAIVSIVFNVYRGQGSTAGQSARLALRRLRSLLAGELLYLLIAIGIVLVGLVFASVLVLGGGLLTFLALVVLVGTVAAVLFVAVRTALLVQGVIIDEQGGAEAFGRSWRLVAGSGWRVLGYLIAIALLGILASILLGGIPSAILGIDNSTTFGVIAGGVLDGVVGLLLAPIGPIVLTLLYLDLRWQHGETVPRPGGGETPGRPGVVHPRSMPR